MVFAGGCFLACVSALLKVNIYTDLVTTRDLAIHTLFR